MKYRRFGEKAAGFVAYCLIAALVAGHLGGMQSIAYAATGNGSETNTEAAEYVNERITENYSKISAGYKLPSYTGDDIVYNIEENIAENCRELLTEDTRGYEGSSKVLDLTGDTEVRININVEKAGRYILGFEYLSYDSSSLPIELSVRLDGEYPFYESRNVKLVTTWKTQEEPAVDRYNNQIVTLPEKVVRWEKQYMKDSSGRHSNALELELTAGEHEIAINVGEGNFLFGNIVLSAPEKIPAYSGSTVAEGTGLIDIQGENFTYSNDSSVHAATEYDTSLYPYEIGDTVLNTLDDSSFSEAGQTITYEFTAPDTGWYYIALNYRQSEKTDFPVFLDIRVDGQIPNTEFVSYPLAYTTKYKRTTLQDSDGEKLSIYLTEGTHTLSFTISIDVICEVMEALDEIMSGIKDLELEITKVAGTNADKYRDLKLSKYIPDLEERLNGYADELTELEKSMLPYSNSDKNVAVMSSMLIAAKQLRSLADNVDEIPYRISELSSSQNSANQYLANTIDSLIKNNLAIDRIFIYQEDAVLPKKPGFFKSMWMNLKRFFYSFFDQAYSTSNTDPEHLQVWVNRSSLYVQIMQKMIDEKFTPQTGIEVDISIMPDQYKLVLSNSSGNSPDVATGINYTIPYELAIRGALVDISSFDDFKETVKDYNTGFFMTGTINGKIYSMPETMNFWVLFYRKDVLEKLGLEVPETMDDVIDMLPELQMRGLNFYYPTSGMIAMRNFHGTAPLIMQNGGTLYGMTAQDGTALGSRESIEGFTTLTDLYTIYNLAVNVDNYYQHFRNGDMPIGIADFGTYNLIKNAAPELASLWEIALIPGTVQEDGSIDRTTCGCAESTVIFTSDSEREAKAWEFIKWWSSADIQSEFGQMLQITYGDEYMWPTANMAAFMELPWDSDDKKIIVQAAENVVDIARVPGTYLVEREMSNAFNDIVVNGMNEQTRIDKAVKVINREIMRKLEEFGYIDSDGNTIKEYTVPTYEYVNELLGRAE